MHKRYIVVAVAVTCFHYIILNYSLSYDFKNTNSNLIIRENYKDNVLNKMKYILLWPKRNCYGCAPFNYLPEGRNIFMEGNCPVQNCYITENRSLIGDDNKFDMILFNGRPILSMNHLDFGEGRSPHQIYVFVQLEAAERFPVCNKKFDNFFNATMTYRLDSDFSWPYLEVILKNDSVIGPNKNPQWAHSSEMSNNTRKLTEVLKSKRKAVAWFVSNCQTLSRREFFVETLKLELLKYDLKIDTYGRCGSLKCSRDKEDTCNEILERDYFFYLAFENTFSEDYVTEKLLRALHFNVVPIVYGGANYSRFLPPGSYLNARELGHVKLAETIAHLITENRTAYEYMYAWKLHYVYRNATLTSFCKLCIKIHEKQRENVYAKFREWTTIPIPSLSVSEAL